MAKPRPATAKGRRARDTIVNAAAILMHEHGIAATSVDDVTLASNTGKSQVYHYFTDKTDLTMAVIERQLDRTLATQPVLRDTSSADLFQWRDQVISSFRESGFASSPLGAFAGQVDDAPILREALARAFHLCQEALTRLVERARDAGVLRPDVDPAGAGAALLAAMEGGILLAHLTQDETALHCALDQALRGLAAKPPTTGQTPRTDDSEKVVADAIMLGA